MTKAQRLSGTGSFGWNVSSGEIFWSEESFRIFGYDKALSTTVEMVLQRVHPEDLVLVKSTFDRASRDGGDFDLEHRLLMPDGSVRNIHVVAHAVRDEAGQLEFHGALMDVTTAKRAEEDLHKARTELAHVTRVTTLGELTASIAHEVNQPLAAIVTNGNAASRFLANATPDLSEAQAAVKRIVSDGHRAAEVITSIKAMFKDVDREKIPLDINKLIRDVLVLVLGELRAYQVSVHTDLNDKLPDVRGNGVQLQQVILNLIMNALEAMNSVTNRPRMLRLKTEFHEPDGVLVLVEDFWNGYRSEKHGPHIRFIFHNQIARHGYGTFPLPFDHRSP